MYKALLLSLFVTFIFSCAERDRTNIFDPLAGIDTLDMSLYVTRADELVNIEWYPPSKIDYYGFNIYRKTTQDEAYTQIASLEQNQSGFSDTDTGFDVTYLYYLTIQGKDDESPPTRNIVVTPGPLSFWILDRYGLNMYRTTYDLRHTRLTKYAVWIPEDLSVDPIHNRVLVTYPQYRFAEIFDETGGKTEINLSQFDHPFGCIFEPDYQKFWLTDSSGFVYTIDPVAGNIELIDPSLNKPTQVVTSESYIYLIDSGNEQIISYDKIGNRQSTIKNIGTITLKKPLFIEPVISSGDLFIIDQAEDNRILYRFNRSENSLTEIYTDQHLKTVRFDAEKNSVWLSIDNELNSVIMQLSADGVRLKMLSGFAGIADFRYNPQTSSLIVVDSGERIVKHIRSDESVIGVFEEAVYPSKVFTE